MAHTRSYLSFVGLNMCLSCIATDIFSVEYWRDLKIWVRGHSKSLKMALIIIYDLLLVSYCEYLVSL